MDIQKIINLPSFDSLISNILDNPLFLVDILIVLMLFYWVYNLLKNTRAVRILYGVFILAIVVYISSLLHLTLLSLILGALLAIILVAIPVVFQPELRNALEKLGRTSIKPGLFKEKGSPKFLETLIDAVETMAQKRIGGIIAIQRKTGLNDFLKTGISLDSRISKELILSCFITESPLHDGAIIISNNRILGASCIFPLSEDDKTKTLGTRHKAAVGLSEQTDAIVIVISEKTGEVSLALEGIFEKNIDAVDLAKKLKLLLKDYGSHKLRFIDRFSNEQ